jgi:hypothetical protein
MWAKHAIFTGFSGEERGLQHRALWAEEESSITY